MSLAHALLTSLLEQASSGYDLARRFDKSIGHFWQATHQQIYRELGRMEKAGWIRSTPDPDAGRTRKRRYSVLPGGRDELMRWAAESAPLPELRDEFMVRLRADAVIGPLGLLPELGRRRALHADKLRAYRAIEARDFPPDPQASRQRRIHHLILKAGIQYEEGWIAWYDEALGVLEHA
ncbi:PadR family transcriptional regulator [Thauera sp.]|jgi:DNA-binding PadR family transcriptional regulator|uniref:PadR family transcriptional regulator n=1 Tax=Thauera sp. TaxID=1905334 RepID=UPI0026046F98|nr:PadR family transcriptional regulator [Thauera sp.]MCK6409752.1 PadR family transcriptional regulator [Thauera sp.]